MLGVAEADLQLEGGFCPCERRPRHAQIARRACRRERSAFRGFTMARGRVARGPGAPSSPQTGTERVRIHLPPAASQRRTPPRTGAKPVRHRFKRPTGGSTGQPKNLRGTDGSNPSPSSKESANHRFLSGGKRPRAVKSHIAFKRNPRPIIRGLHQIPCGTTEHSGLSAGDYSSPPLYCTTFDLRLMLKGSRQA
jgi:hypothetical protein